MKKTNKQRKFARRAFRRIFSLTLAAMLMMGVMFSSSAAAVTVNRAGSNAAAVTGGAVKAVAKTYSGYMYCTADDFVALRADATAGSRLLAKIPRGERMRSMNEKKGKWRLVEYGSKIGYVHSDYVSTVKPTASIFYCTADDFVALRAGATSGSRLLTKIPRGNSMTYQNKKVGKWYYVKYGTLKGYVHGDYISAQKPSATLYCIAEGYANLYSKANANSTRLAKVRRYASVTDLNQKCGNWRYVRYGKYSGYVLNSYLTANKPSTTTLYCIADDFVALRESAKTNSPLLVKIPRGGSMEYLNKKYNNWYYVRYGKSYGYVYGDYVSTRRP